MKMKKSLSRRVARLERLGVVFGRLFDRVIAEVGPKQALKIIFTPENVEAAFRGLGEGLRNDN